MTACALLLAQGIACAAPVTYAIDPVHTRVLFAISHAGFSHALGTVSGSTGILLFDQDDWNSAHVEVSVPIARADLGDEKWNKAALAGNLLDAKAFAAATFVSTRIEPIDATHATIVGTLTLRGVAKEVKLDAVLNAAKRHPLPPFRRTVGFSATTSLSRKEFGITAWPSVIGDQVDLRIEVEATRAANTRLANATPASPETAPPDVAAPDPAGSDSAAQEPPAPQSGVPDAAAPDSSEPMPSSDPATEPPPTP